MLFDGFILLKSVVCIFNLSEITQTFYIALGSICIKKYNKNWVDFLEKIVHFNTHYSKLSIEDSNSLHSVRTSICIIKLKN